MKYRLISFGMAIVVIIVFGIFIYPGIYKYDKLNQNLPVKINRFTGETQVLYNDGWKNINNISDKNLNSPSTSTTAKNTIKNDKITAKGFEADDKIALGDISKVKVMGDTSDNSYYYKIACTVKNEDTLDNNIYVQATLYDDNKKPINILKSTTEYIESGGTIVINLATDDYNMTLKYKNYKLEIFQDPNLGYSYERKKALGIK